MKDCPIIFTAENVRAILQGRKTQTRRVFKEAPPVIPDGFYWSPYNKSEQWGVWECGTNRMLAPVVYRCPYGVPGDRLWVRETWTSGYQNGAWGTICAADSAFIQGKRQHEKGPHFHAKEIGPHVRWRPSIFMPRWASRITLEITDVRVQRLQEITEEDCCAEGILVNHSACSVECGHLSTEPSLQRQVRRDFKKLWDSINAKKHPWASNPWTWAITFRSIEDLKEVGL